MRWVDGFTDSMGISLSKLWEMVKDRKPWHSAFQKVVKGQTRLSMYIYNKVMIQIVFPDRRRMRSELKETETSKNLGEVYQIESKTQRTHSRKLHRGPLASLDKF